MCPITKKKQTNKKSQVLLILVFFVCVQIAQKKINKGQVLVSDLFMVL